MEHSTDILIAGGGLGGVAAALAAARMGRRVILTEETDWLGGQLTAQGVPFDEHPWIEAFGCTESYRTLREGIRRYYREHYPLTASARAERLFNPGASLVSRLSCEPRAAAAVLDALLAPYRAAGRITVMLRVTPRAADSDGDRVRAVTFEDHDSGKRHTISARYILDATERGDLLPLAGVEYVTGTESQRDTGELHAPTGPAQPQNMQAFTYCLALDYHPGEDHTIARPAEYDFWRSYQAPFQTAPHLSFERPQMTYDLFAAPESGRFSLWQFRRVLYAGHFAPGFAASDQTILNCTQNDYWLGSIVDVPAGEEQHHLRRAQQASLSLLYWLQTDAPRPDGGAGYPGLRPSPDVFGTPDGFARYPYIREARRIRAEFTVLEQHVGVEAREGASGAEVFPDSVGIGSYRIDLHPTTGGDASLNIASWPFQIPLGALIPVRVENLLPAAKNIGMTHITNGCYRLHPVEWNIGEAAGALAAYCLDRALTPRQVRSTPEHLADFQATLMQQGVELAWPQLAPGTSYYKWAITQPGWTWGET